MNRTIHAEFKHSRISPQTSDSPPLASRSGVGRGEFVACLDMLLNTESGDKCDDPIFDGIKSSVKLIVPAIY